MEEPPSDSQNPYASPAMPAEAASPDANISAVPLLEPIRISSALSPTEYFDCIELANQQSGKQLRSAGVLLAILYVVMFCVLAPDLFHGSVLMGIVILVAVAAVGTGIGILVWWPLRKHIRTAQRWLTVRRVKKLHDSKRGPFSEIDYVIAEDGIEIRTQHEDAKIQWSAYSGYRSSDFCVLLLYPTRTFNCLVRSKFSRDGDWQRFLALLDRKLPRC